jgi:hypothetical protein
LSRSFATSDFRVGSAVTFKLSAITSCWCFCAQNEVYRH